MMAISKFEIAWTVFPEMSRTQTGSSEFRFSNAQLSRECRAHQSAKRIFSRYAKMLQAIEHVPRERLDILAVCKEINDTARRVKQESDALRKSSQDALARQKH
jgi:hypothetical protein